MSTLRGFVSVLIFLVCGEFSFHCRCAEPANELRRCYDVGYNTFCFFRPESGYKLMKKKGAYQTCHRNNATLLAIPSEEAQNALEIYMKFLKLEHSHELWMAGQEVRGREWKWLNGRTANLTASQLRGNRSHDYVQGVLTEHMLYRRDVPSKRNHFVCQLKGMSCRSNHSIPLGEGCVLAAITGTMNLYHARNRCVKEGGDLLVIDNPGDLDRLGEIITRISNVNKVWIGLRRQWWSWNATDSAVDIKYSNWLPKHGFKPNRRCMIIEMKKYKFATTPPISITEAISVLNPISFITFSALGIFVLVFLIIIAVLLRRQRKSRDQRSDSWRVTSDRSYQDLHDRQGVQYMELDLTTRPQTELIPNYLDDGEVKCVPTYLDIIP